MCTIYCVTVVSSLNIIYTYQLKKLYTHNINGDLKNVLQHNRLGWFQNMEVINSINLL